ncbi:MAG: DUF1570 domain-containing protein [Planctomycetota bacterium]
MIPASRTLAAVILSVVGIGAFAIIALPATTVSAHQAPALQSYSSRHYQIETDLPRERASRFADHMDRVFDEFERLFDDFELKHPTRPRLYLLSTEDAYLRTLATKGINGRGSGGMYFRRANESGVVTWIEGRPADRVHHVLQHEAFHQFAYHYLGGGLPAWANEGIAEYFGNALLVGGEFQTNVFSASNLATIRGAIQTNQSLPFEDLFYAEREEWNRVVTSRDPRAGLAYLQSWSMVHFLVNAEGGTYQDAFMTFVRAAGNGMAPKQAAAKAFGSDDLLPFERAWREYVLNEQQPDPTSTNMERLRFLASGLEELHGLGIHPMSIYELQAQLIEIRFAWTRANLHTVTLPPLRADDQMLYTPAEAQITRGRRSQPAPRFEIIPAPRTKGSPPPALRLVGTPVPMTGTWTATGDGTWMFEIEID